MAGVQYRNGRYRVVFRYLGKQHAFTIGEVSKDEAETKSAQVDYLLMRIKQRLASLPPGTDIVEYVQFDGKERPVEISSPPAKLSLAKLRDRYLVTHEASLEDNTLATIRMHFRHLVGRLGESFPIAELSLADLQRYVDYRAKAAGINGRKLSAVTIQKEIVSLRTAWNWGVKMKLLGGRFPYDGLRYPKSTEKPCFQTRAEIERQIKAGGLTEAEQADLYDSLYLQLHETTELLAYVKENSSHRFIYPMFCLAAHTGARRSEIVRMRIADVDLMGKILTIRERKRVQGRATTRRIPISAFLIGIIKQWLADHPGGSWLFCHELTVALSKKRSPTTGHLGQKTRPKTGNERLAKVRRRETTAIAALTKDEAHHYFKSTLAGSTWSVLRGWHVLRHSFVSACASCGVDQRLIESWAGHMSPEMSRRYAHLYPSRQQEALSAVFAQGV
jgi:integrase